MTRPLLLTRSASQSEALAAIAQKAMPGKFTPLVAPLFDIRPEPCDVDLDGVQALLFTSAHAVREFARRSTDRSVPALCVGNATAETANEAGFATQSASGDVSALAQLAMLSYIPDFGSLLHIRGAHTAGDLTGALLAEGIPAQERIIYDQVNRPLPADILDRLEVAGEIVAPVFSPRTAAFLVDELPVSVQKRVHFLCISRNTRDALGQIPDAKFTIAPSQDLEGILKILMSV